MEGVEASGKSVEEAIARALAELELERGEVEVEVLSPGRGGILGLGAEPARVLVRPRKEGVPAPQQLAELGREVVERILSALRIRARVEVIMPSEPDSPVVLDIRDDDLGILIGRRGTTLASLQYLVMVILSRRLGRRVALMVDVDGYRQRRDRALHDLALRMARRVADTGQSVSLEPMPAAERRIVHLALHDHSQVITESIGEGEQRQVVIRHRPR